MTSDEAHNKAIRMNKMAEADGFGIGLYAPRWVGSGNNYSILRRGFTFLEREYIFSGVILDPGEKYENA